MARAKPGGWAPNEKLTSAQSTAMDVNIDALATLTEIAGVKKLRTYASRAALRAVVDYEDGDCAYVPGRGLYRFDPTTALNGGTFERPDDILLGDPGRWVSMLDAWLGKAYGAAQLDDFARLPARTVKRGLIDRARVSVAPPINVTATTPTVIPSVNMTSTIEVAIGDEIDIRYESSASTADSLGVMIGISYGGGPFAALPVGRLCGGSNAGALPGTNSYPLTISGFVVATEAGYVTACLYASADSQPLVPTLTFTVGDMQIRRP